MSVTLPDDFVLPQGLVEDISEDEGGDGSRQPTITGALLEGVSSADEQPDNNIRNETGGRAAAAVPQEWAQRIDDDDAFDPRIVADPPRGLLHDLRGGLQKLLG